MRFSDLCKQNDQSDLNENSMKYEALSIAKQLHTSLAELTFIEMLSVMDPANPAKKEVQELETKLNTLTSEVGDFIQKYIPDVSDADAGDVSDQEEDQEDKKDSNKKK